MAILFLVQAAFGAIFFRFHRSIGHVPACPIFLLAHPANGGNARLSRVCGLPSSRPMKFFGEERELSWWMTSPPYAAMAEHVA